MLVKQQHCRSKDPKKYDRVRDCGVTNQRKSLSLAHLLSQPEAKHPCDAAGKSSWFVGRGILLILGDSSSPPVLPADQNFSIFEGILCLTFHADEAMVR
jgi:hypothetical protein